MKSTIKILGIALAASTALATAAHAQREGYGSAQPRQQQQPQARGEQKEEKPQRGGATVTIGDKKINISAQFATAYKEQIAAFEAKDTAGFAAKSAAAHAAAKSPDEHFLASQVDLKSAAESGRAFSRRTSWVLHTRPSARSVTI